MISGRLDLFLSISTSSRERAFQFRKGKTLRELSFYISWSIRFILLKWKENFPGWEKIFFSLRDLLSLSRENVSSNISWENSGFSYFSFLVLSGDCEHKPWTLRIETLSFSLVQLVVTISLHLFNLFVPKYSSSDEPNMSEKLCLWKVFPLKTREKKVWEKFILFGFPPYCSSFDCHNT